MDLNGNGHYGYEHEDQLDHEHGVDGDEHEHEHEQSERSPLAPGGGPGPAPASEPAASVKPKRTHVQAACTFCKGRKMRCDGARPSCANCMNRKQHCDYPNYVKHRGPNKHAKAPSAQDDQAAAQSAAAAAAAAAAAGQAHMTPYNVNGVIMYHPGMAGPSAYGAGMVMPHYATAPPPASPTRKRSAEELDGEDDLQEDSPGGEGEEYIMNADGTPGGRRRNALRGGKRATMACHSCRTRKMKCDEAHPACSQCTRRSIPCAYDDFVRRRGPSKKKRIEGTEVHLITSPSPAQPQPHAAAAAAPAPHMNLVPMPYSFPGAPPDAPKYMALMDPNGVPVQILGIEHPGMHPHHPHMVSMMHGAHNHGQDDGEDDGGDESPQANGDNDDNGDDDIDGLGQPAQAPQVVWS